MATYLIGDVQGCYLALRQLLTRFSFRPAQDTLWFCGDLVNRGPASLDVLRFISDLPKKVVVLGNHDLHLLALHAGVRRSKPLDTLEQVLDAQEADSLCHWLRQQAFLHQEGKTLLVHAGLAPQWDISMAIQCAKEVSDALRGEQYANFLKQIFGDEPSLWSSDLQGLERLRFSVNCFTRLRFCDKDGKIDLHYKGELETAPSHLLPWFDVKGRQTSAYKIFFGHWSALQGKICREDVVALDTGCVWGGCLSAYSLEDGQWFREKCISYAKF